MGRIQIDISATLINETAVKFLIRDTMRALKGNTSGYQLFGEPFDDPEVPATVRARLLRQFYAGIGSGSVRQAEARGTDPQLFFDPIYTLFGDLKESDYVFVLDMTPLTNPEWHGPNVSRLYEQAFQKILISRCHTIHISRNTLLTMRAVLGSEGSNATVLHLYMRHLRENSAAVCHHFFDLGKYLLFVGSLEERKNVAGLICAFEISRLATRGYKLVIAGGDGQGAPDIRAIAQRTRGVVIPGYVSDGDLHHLYEGAVAFVYPSYLEGFGMPLLEAMAYGLPCIASMTGACPEVGGGDVVYVDPFDVIAISQAMLELADTSGEARKEIGARGQMRAEQIFTFDRYETGLRSILSTALS